MLIRVALGGRGMDAKDPIRDLQALRTDVFQAGQTEGAENEGIEGKEVPCSPNARHPGEPRTGPTLDHGIPPNEPQIQRDRIRRSGRHGHPMRDERQGKQGRARLYREPDTGRRGWELDRFLVLSLGPADEGALSSGAVNCRSKGGERAVSIAAPMTHVAVLYRVGCDWDGPRFWAEARVQTGGITRSAFVEGETMARLEGALSGRLRELGVTCQRPLPG